MTDSIEIQPVRGPVEGSIRPPGSKSITNRALVCAALAEGTSTLTGALVSEDTRVMIDSLRKLGVPIAEEDGGRTLVVEGCGGVLPAREAELFVENSGTTMRFLTAVASLGRGRYRIDGVERMRERPIADQIAALRALGASVESELGTGCPPVVVEAAGLAGGEAVVRGDVSSQFLSGILMAAPCAAGPVVLRVEGTLVSVPYVEMTARVMEAFGAEVTHEPDFGAIRVGAPSRYTGRRYAIEPDASAASYFLAAAAITGGEVTVEGLGEGSLQGDTRFAECLGRMGCVVRTTGDSITVTGAPLRAIDVDMNDISDTVQTLSVVALFAGGTTEIRNVAHIRHKETDRLAALATELAKLGAGVVETDDGLRITPGELHGAEIETYRDHRMAMSLSLAGLRVPGVRILDPGCTQKTYPEYFTDLERLTTGV